MITETIRFTISHHCALEAELPLDKSSMRRKLRDACWELLQNSIIQKWRQHRAWLAEQPRQKSEESDWTWEQRMNRELK